MTQIKNLETKNNNLNEISLDFTDSNMNKIKFYTSPDDIYNYRSAYPYTNFSFTPHSNINGPIDNNFALGFPMFPTIPNSYKMNMQGIAETNIEDNNDFTNLPKNDRKGDSNEREE